ncbi:MAG TPA: prepilin-type N-terminal cleavage/methylation domain-containing protein [Sedimentisphaerales bacterium]|nr:prepilin-type N-terminal cleavage/methylation domain-containing protein [Sedimentisphaerales bacterium]
MKPYINKHPAKKFSNQNGFTLIEILMAMMITTILAAGINASYRQISTVFNNIQQQKDIYQQSNDLIATLRDELAGLYLPASADPNSNQVSFILSLTNSTQELTFFTMTPSWNQIPAYGKIAKVTYSFQKTNDTTQLIHKEQLYSGEKPIDKESSQLIDEKLSEFDINVTDSFSTDDNSWQKTYNSESSVPKALKIHLKYPSGKNQACTDFNTTFAVRREN